MDTTELENILMTMDQIQQSIEVMEANLKRLRHQLSLGASVSPESNQVDQSGSQCLH